VANQKKKSSDSKKSVSLEKPSIEPKVIEKEHKEFRTEILEIKTFLRRFSGPLPPPNAFAKYDQILEGSANRILTMAEKEQENRQKILNEKIKSDIINEKLGIIFGFIVALSAIAGSVYCAHIGQTLAAIAIGGGIVVGLVAAFVEGTRVKGKKK